MGVFKKIFSFVIIIAIVSMTFMSVQNVSGEDYMIMRDITAYDLVAEMNVGISIGNSMDSVGSSETAWGNPAITKELIRKYKEVGFNTIRLPITWVKHIDSLGNPKPSWMKRVNEVVDMILSEGLYCIINTHHEQNWLKTCDEGMEQRKVMFSNLWTAIAERFKDYGDHLLFEGYNEILKAEGDWSAAEDSDYDNTNIIAQLFVDTVRATGGNNLKRTLIVSTYGAIHDTFGFELPKDTVENRLAVEFHCYYLQQFCFVWGSQTTWGSTSDINAVERYCKTFYPFIEQNVPVILGEFGAVNKNNNTSARAAYAATVASTCKKYKIKAIWWDNGTISVSSGNTEDDSFALIDRNNYSVAMPDIINSLLNNSESIVKTDYSTVPTESTTTKKVVSTTTTVPTTRLITDTMVGSIINEKIKLTTAKTVKLSWSAIDGVTGYKIFRSVGNGSLIEYKSLTTNSFTDSVSAGKTYCYKVIGYKDIDGTLYFGDSSSKLKVTTLSNKIGTVKKSTTKTTATITTNSVVGASKYVIKYSVNKNMKKSKTVTKSSKTIKLTKLTKNKKYYASVRAYKVINGKKVYTSTKYFTFKTKS